MSISIEIAQSQVSDDQVSVQDPLVSEFVRLLQRVDLHDAAGVNAGHLFADPAAMQAVRYVNGLQISGGASLVMDQYPPDPALAEAGFASVVEAVMSVEPEPRTAGQPVAE
ncbi:hypothetical protein ABIB25_005903 [Nakamurella sp. UYEF19]|uniref:hypothetical protein n=1 Tax=Nakamurella sp. UYEF19 TaxID=1756392 RepID=UPI003392AC4D